MTWRKTSLINKIKKKISRQHIIKSRKELTKNELHEALIRRELQIEGLMNRCRKLENNNEMKLKQIKNLKAKLSRANDFIKRLKWHITVR